MRQHSGLKASIAHEPAACIGCGVCAGICPDGRISMAMNAYGEYVPAGFDTCLHSCGACRQVCPFGNGFENENVLAAGIFGDIVGIQHAQPIGFYINAYAGHCAVGDFRAKGASGGLAAWFLTALLEHRIVDRVICVQNCPGPVPLFQFSVLDSIGAVRQSAGSAYYPVELSGVIRTVLSEDARYAVIGLPCHLKALRLAMNRNPLLGRRVLILAGLVCGHLMTADYAEYLVRRLGFETSGICSICFRGKNPGSMSTDSVFMATSGSETRSLHSREFSRIWASGQFKPRACNFCDDIFAEVADVVFMDAWLPRYIPDWRGTSITVSRSARVEELISTGIREGELIMEKIPASQVIASQAGVVRQKREFLSYRLWLADRRGDSRPEKRVRAQKPTSLQAGIIRAGESLRQASRNAMTRQRASGRPGLGTYFRLTLMPRLRWRMMEIRRDLPNMVQAKLKRIRRAPSPGKVVAE